MSEKKNYTINMRMTEEEFEASQALIEELRQVGSLKLIKGDVVGEIINCAVRNPFGIKQYIRDKLQ